MATVTEDILRLCASEATTNSIFNLEEKKCPLTIDPSMSMGESLPDNPRHDVFTVDPFQSLSIPSGSGMPKWIDRMQGENCVEIIDINNSHSPDDGDTCVARNGAFYPDARFVGDPFAVNIEGKTCDTSQWMKFEDCARVYYPVHGYPDYYAKSHYAEILDPTGDRTAKTFDVYNPGAVEDLLIGLAHETAVYVENVAVQAKGATEDLVGLPQEHPVATFFVGAVFIGLIAHPVTRGPTLSLLNWLGGAGAVVGSGYILYDRTEAIAELSNSGDLEYFKENVAEYDFMALTALLGAGALKGVSVPDAARKVFYLPETLATKAVSVGDAVAANIFGDFGGGGMVLAPSFAGAGRSFSAGAVSVSGVIATDSAGVFTGGSFVFPVMFSVASNKTLIERHDGKKYNIEVFPPEKSYRLWKDSKVDSLADEVEILMMDVELPESEISQFRQHINVIKEIYENSPEPEVINDIVTMLERMSMSTRSLFEREEIAGGYSQIRAAFYNDFDRIISRHGMFYLPKGKPITVVKKSVAKPVTVKTQKIGGKDFILDKDGLLEDLPKAVVLDDVARTQTIGGGYQEYLNRAIRFFSRVDNGDALPLGNIRSNIRIDDLPLINEYRFGIGGAVGAPVRVVYHQTGGSSPKIIILRVFNDHTELGQRAHLKAAAELAKKLCLPAIGIGVLNFEEE